MAYSHYAPLPLCAFISIPHLQVSISSSLIPGRLGEAKQIQPLLSQILRHRVIFPQRCYGATT